MKIVFVFEWFYNIVGGAERVLVELANEMVARKHDVSIIMFQARVSRHDGPVYPLHPAVRVVNLYPWQEESADRKTCPTASPASLRNRLKSRLPYPLLAGLRFSREIIRNIPPHAGRRDWLRKKIP